MKHTTPLFIVALAAVLIPFSVAASDTPPEPELQLVNATGYGTTVKEASLAAIRAAVESVVGTLVDAETLVENDDLIQNQILTYSTGLVESAEYIGSPTKTESGLYQVRIRAKVKRTQIQEKLPNRKPASQAAVQTVDGQSLFFKRASGRQNLEDAEAMMRAVFTPDKMLACLKADVVAGENGPLQLDANTGELSATVRVWVDLDAYKMFANEIIDKIGPMAEKREEFSKVEESVRGVFDNLGRGYNWDVVRTPYFCQLAVVSNYRSGKLTLFSFEEAKGMKLCQSIHPLQLLLRTSLLDKRGDEIKISKVEVREEIYGRRNYTHGGILNFYDHSPAFFYPDRYRAIVLAPFVACYHCGYGGDECEAQVSGFSETTVRVSFGRMQEDELADIASVSAELCLEPDHR